MSNLERGYARAACINESGVFSCQIMYKKIYFMLTKDKARQKVVAHMFGITTSRVKQIKKQYIAKHIENDLA